MSNVRILFSELDQTCVVCSDRGLQTVPSRSITLPTRAERDVVAATINGKEVFAISIPVARVVNEWASLAMGRTVRGTAVIVCKDGITSEEVFALKKPTWASLASKLPAKVELDDIGKRRLEDESAERHQRWQEYWKRKRDRKREARHARGHFSDDEDDPGVDLKTIASEQFADWLVDEPPAEAESS